MSATTGTLQTTYPQRKQNRQMDFWQTNLICINSRRISNRPMTDVKLKVIALSEIEPTLRFLSNFACLLFILYMYMY